MIALVILVCVISVNVLLGDTLSDYAEANPEIAYATPDPDSAKTPETQLLDSISEDVPEEAPAEASAEEQADAPTDEQSEVSAEEQSEASAEESAETLPTSALPEYNTSVQVHFYDPDVTEAYAPGFYYQELTDEMTDYITGVSYPSDVAEPAITYDDLRYVGILYNDFNGLTQAGELICNKAIAEDLVEIFHELYLSGYSIEKVVLVDNYGGDDTASMSADNTSCFNYRVVDGSASLSKHAYGLAIDINPFYNPYVVFGKGEGGTDYISPAGSEVYADRSVSFAYKIDEKDLCYRLFKEHGFTWGGDWNSCKDYQHFQKTISDP